MMRDTTVSFAAVLFRLRKRHFGKQLALATVLGRTEAAVSYWENGRRLPQDDSLPRLLDCFRSSGALESEVAELQEAYDENRKFDVDPTTNGCPILGSYKEKGESDGQFHSAG